jgi:hypothetical protein
MHVASPPGTVALHALPENGFAFRPIRRPRMRSWPLPVSKVAEAISGPSEAHPKHTAQLWSNHIPVAFGVSSSANKKREAPFERRSRLRSFVRPRLPLCRSAQKPAEPCRRQVGQSRTPRKRSALCAVLRCRSARKPSRLRLPA